ncbi:aspartate aminotransferase family protein [Clostridium botulinum]|uniref:pyridoxal phosphate-dependent decarboxylase family protein n=1 Tax=Clostridium botulinum TaxID=1491 RepID=UPI00052DB120|nr:pyridoxal-dependent decarboxylase [Clostridium botulinum]KGM94475.1 L-2,4-diaminobutyrate decarboxylase [Clostridium botulinum D str. CCUG 7971]OOV50805.1 aspartate aminotransferase family protein [Clostridium botulinum D/C]KOC48066.1 L-2,4-diaminobutyrate decarboxylase [Clostridium botulinum]NFO98655.1 aspartate aminotransferase family protein [Clostridium botulinum]OOV53293.1 aspartate aminotransferase family protein [Clostridium botulinum D/C]
MKMIKQNESLNWQKVLKEKVQPAFLSPCQEQSKEDEFKDIITQTLKNVNDLKDDGQEKKSFLGEARCCIEDENSIIEVKKKANIPEKATSMKEVIKEASKYFNGMFNWAHPKAMVNVTPPAAIPSIAGSLMGAMFNPNIVEQEYSGNVAALEIEVASIISKLVGYDSEKSIGHFTFGGTGAYLFATKLALTKCLGKESRTNGIRTDAQILVSKVGHYAMKNCSDWTGLGTNNVRTINLNEDSSMNLSHLEEVMETCYKEGKPIAMIVVTMGTTDAFAIDDIKGVMEICNNFVKKHNLKERPFIYADAVIGWAWSVFNSYDFKENPMEFSETTLKAIEKSKDKIKYLNLADAVGIDFHKTGFTCYNCSMICMKNSNDIQVLTRDKDQMAYLYHSSAYTPGEYTLECSRGGGYALSAWCNLKYFGLEGYRAILGNLIEVEMSLRNVIRKEPSMVCVNGNDNGLVTLFRVYPDSLKDKTNFDDFARQQYKNEFCNEDYKKDLKEYNDYQAKVAKELEMLMLEENGPALSFTSKFRLSSYGEPVAAIKAYPMSPYMSSSEKELKEDIIKFVLKAKENIKKL